MVRIKLFAHILGCWNTSANVNVLIFSLLANRLASGLACVGRQLLLTKCSTNYNVVILYAFKIYSSNKTDVETLLDELCLNLRGCHFVLKSSGDLQAETKKKASVMFIRCNLGNLMSKWKMHEIL